MVLFQNRHLNNGMIIPNHYFTICGHLLTFFVVNDVTFVPGCVFCIVYRDVRIKEIGSNKHVF